jgi:hypothetical protein
LIAIDFAALTEASTLAAKRFVREGWRGAASG